MARDLFISYRTQDKEAAQRICAALEHENISCWMAPRDIPIGREWAAAIVEGIQRCKAFLVILSSNSKAAKQISREAELADSQGIPMMAFRIEDVQPAPGLLYFLSNTQWLDAFGGHFDSALAQLIEVIKQSEGYPAEKTTNRIVRSRESTTSQPSRNVHSAASICDFPVSSATSDTPADEPSLSTGVAPVPTEPMFSESATPPSRKMSDHPAVWMGLGASVVVALCLIGWFWFRHSFPNLASSPPITSEADAKTFPVRKPALSYSDAETQAKAVADRFLKECDSGDLDTAWGELSGPYRNRLDKARWRENLENARRRFGKTQSQVSACTPDGQREYVCDYTVLGANQVSQKGELKVTRNEDGTWAISGAKHLP